MPDKPSAMGDIVMSVVPIAQFRQQHQDPGPGYIWMPCDGSSLAGTPLGAVLPRTPDFTSRYPRGAGPVPDLGSGENGQVGTTVSQRLLKHSHTVTLNLQHFKHGEDETGPVHNPNPEQMTATTSGANVGDSSENRPNSVVVYFYIRVR